MKTGPSNTFLALTACAVFAATALAGWQLAEQRGSTPSLTSDDAARAGTKSEKRAPSRTRNGGFPDEASSVLDAIRAEKDPVRRMQLVIALANTLPLADLRKWLDHGWNEGLGGYEMTLFAQVDRQRWRHEDPAGEFEYAHQCNDGMISNSIREWARRDPTALWEKLKKHRSEDNMEIVALRTMAESNPGMALGYMHELFGTPGRTPPPLSLTANLLYQIAGKDPQGMTAALANMPPDLRSRAEDALAGQALGKDFAGQLGKFAAKGDGQAFERALASSGRAPLDPAQITAAASLLTPGYREILTKHPATYIDASNAAQWLDTDLTESGFTDEQAWRIRRGALENLHATDPVRAMALLDAETKDPKQRAQTLAAMLYKVRDEVKLRALIDQLPNEADRKEMDQRFTFIFRQAPTPPPGPDEWLAAATAPEGVKPPQPNALASWTPQEIEAFSDRFHDLPADQKLASAKALITSIAASPQAATLKGEAIRYLLGDPAYPDGHSAASAHVARWVDQDPAAACGWVQSLPEGPAKASSELTIAVNWAKHDPAAVRRWADSLPAANKAAVLSVLPPAPVPR